jgi:plasmid stability protein
LNMCSTRDNVMHMSMIQIRNVPDEVHRTLKMRAAAAGMSLSDYIKGDLVRKASLPTLDEIDARIQAQGPSNLKTATVLSALREVRDD